MPAEEGRAPTTAACCPFHNEKIAVVHGQPDQAVLSLLRLRRARHRDRFPDGVLRPRLPRRGQGPRAARRHGSAARRRRAAAARQRRARARADLYARRCDDARCEFYRSSCTSAPRAIDYLKRRGLDRRNRRALRHRLRAGGWQSLQARVSRLRRRCRWSKRGLVIDKSDEGQALRPLPRSHHVPDPQRRGTRDRLRRPRARPGRAEVPELAGDPAVPQGPRALRPVRGAPGDPRRRARARGRGLHGRRGARAVRRRATRWPRSAPRRTPVHVQKLLRQTDEVVFCFDGDAPGRKAAWRALEVSLPHRGRQQADPLPVPARKATIRTPTCASTGRTASKRSCARPRRSPSSCSRSCAPSATWQTAEGRAAAHRRSRSRMCRRSPRPRCGCMHRRDRASSQAVPRRGRRGAARAAAEAALLAPGARTAAITAPDSPEWSLLYSLLCNSSLAEHIDAEFLTPSRPESQALLRRARSLPRIRRRALARPAPRPAAGQPLIGNRAARP